MFNRTAGAGSTNTVISWSGRDYINFTSATSGAVYTRFGVDVSAGVSSVSTATFSATQQVLCDDSEYITDEAGNVYYLVSSYTSATTTRPTRV